MQLDPDGGDVGMTDIDNVQLEDSSKEEHEGEVEGIKNERQDGDQQISLSEESD